MSGMSPPDSEARLMICVKRMGSEIRDVYCVPWASE